MTSEELVDELRCEIVKLRGALAHWLPDEASVSSEDHPIWVQHFALLAEDQVDVAPAMADAECQESA
jgi:hypothetical protein